jgi:hypothetical protein
MAEWLGSSLQNCTEEIPMWVRILLGVPWPRSLIGRTLRYGRRGLGVRISPRLQKGNSSLETEEVHQISA